MNELKPLTTFYCSYIASFSESNNLDMAGETLQWSTDLKEFERGTIDQVRGPRNDYVHFRVQARAQGIKRKNEVNCRKGETMTDIAKLVDRLRLLDACREPAQGLIGPVLGPTAYKLAASGNEFAAIHEAIAALESIEADAGRLDWLESQWPTIYRDSTGVDHWVYVNERQRARRGIVADTIRAAIDRAREEGNHD